MDNAQTNTPVAPIMPTGKAMDMMMEILPDMSIIMNDKEAEPMIAALRSDQAGELEAGDAMKVLVPLFAGKYRQQLYRILAACNGCAVEEIDQQDITKTMLTMLNSTKVLTGFFGCCLRMVRSM